MPKCLKWLFYDKILITQVLVRLRENLHIILIHEITEYDKKNNDEA